MDNSQPSIQQQQPSYPPGQFSWPSTSSVGFRSLFYNSQEKLLPLLLSKNDRSQRYKVHLDVAPTLLIFLYIVVAFLFISTCLLIGMFAAPPGTTIVTNLVPYNADYFVRIISFSNFYMTNSFLFYVYVFEFNVTFRLSKDPLSLKTVVIL